MTRRGSFIKEVFFLNLPYQLMFDLSGKRVLVTASTEGIGRGVAEAFSYHGATVVVSSRSSKKVTDTLTRLRKVNPSVYGIEADLTDLKSLDILWEYVIEVIGGIDVLVLNSGNPPREPVTFSEATLDDWEYSLKLYLLGPIKLLSLALPKMVEQRWGRILFLSSWTVKQPQSIFVLADVSRAPLIQLAKILSRDYGKYNITSNVILMGSFQTEGAKRTLSRLAERMGVPFETVWKEKVLDPIPLGRTGDPKEDLGSLLLFLASEYGSYITGSTLLLDGGNTSCVD